MKKEKKRRNVIVGCVLGCVLCCDTTYVMYMYIHVRVCTFQFCVLHKSGSDVIFFLFTVTLYGIVMVGKTKGGGLGGIVCRPGFVYMVTVAAAAAAAARTTTTNEVALYQFPVQQQKRKKRFWISEKRVWPELKQRPRFFAALIHGL